MSKSVSDNSSGVTFTTKGWLGRHRRVSPAPPGETLTT